MPVDLQRDSSSGTSAPSRADRLNLLICGGQRCGTTTLKHCLQDHPEIGFLGEPDLRLGEPAAPVPAPEPRYVGFPFASPSLARSITDGTDDVYRAISRRLAGRVTYIATKWPYFMFYPHVASNIRAHLPDARLLFILRDPVETAHSAWRSGNPDVDLGPDAFHEWVDARIREVEALATPENRAQWLAAFGPGTSTDLSLERGLYGPQIARFAHLFPRAQWHVIRFERFVADPVPELEAVRAFLRLPEHDWSNAGSHLNAAPRPAEMHDRTRRILADYYAASNADLCARLEWPFDPWTMP